MTAPPFSLHSIEALKYDTTISLYPDRTIYTKKIFCLQFGKVAPKRRIESFDLQTTSLQILFVTDTSFWVTARIARRIWRFNPWIEPGLVSAGNLRWLLERNKGRFPSPVQLVHFMTPHAATEFAGHFRDFAPCAATIHHIEDAASSAPASNADAIMTVCAQWHDMLIQVGVPKGNCVMLRNAVNPEEFSPPSAEARRRLREALGLAHPPSA